MAARTMDAVTGKTAVQMTTPGLRASNLASLFSNALAALMFTVPLGTGPAGPVAGVSRICWSICGQRDERVVQAGLVDPQPGSGHAALVQHDDHRAGHVAGPGHHH